MKPVNLWLRAHVAPFWESGSNFQLQNRPELTVPSSLTMGPAAAYMQLLPQTPRLTLHNLHMLLRLLHLRLFQFFVGAELLPRILRQENTVLLACS